MSDKLKVEVVTPHRVVLDKMVEEVIAPGIMGEFGVLIGHAPMLTFIKPGKLSYLENDQFVSFAVGVGFCEVLKDSVSVLVDEAFTREEVDPTAVAAEIQMLEQSLNAMDSTSDPDAHRQLTTKLQLSRAKASLLASI